MCHSDTEFIEVQKKEGLDVNACDRLLSGGDFSNAEQSTRESGEELTDWYVAIVYLKIMLRDKK